MAKIPEELAEEVEGLLNEILTGVILDAPQEQLLKAILKTQIHTNYLLATIVCLYMHEVEKAERAEQAEWGKEEEEVPSLGLGREDNVV